MGVFKKLFTFAALLSLVAFANPTGYSYMNYAVDFPWAVDTQSGFMALLGCVLVCVIFFFFWSSWRTTEFVGKFIFILVLAVTSFIAFTMGAFENVKASSWFIIAVLYLFFVWGMLYLLIKFALFKTRNVDDADTDGN